ncbi:MAG TPA: polyphosphate kinase 2 family protein [Caldilinea sp.]|nr:polyphosphate kinase 2 family protein [Caldilinea sp.]
MNTDKYRVAPHSKIDLKTWEPDDKGVFEGGKKEGEAALPPLNARLETLQELLYAEGKHKLLIVLQGMDTSGKDGVIRHVFEGVNPQGVSVASFKAPTPLELAHDYLWRVHQQTPARGQIAIFNRSHYEDVLVVRVHNLVPPEVWKRRYAQINAFEQQLAEEGTTILKFFLHISKEEQKQRLQKRLAEPEKQWKFSTGDLAERKLWDDFWLPTPRCWKRRVRRTPHGTSCLPTASGIATWSSHTSSSKRWKGCTCATRRPKQGLTTL